jgi:hypothetical protein
MTTEWSPLSMTGIALPALGFAAAMAYGGCPLIAKRMAELSGWDQQCQALVTEQAELERPETDGMAIPRCGDLGTVFGPEFGKLCETIEQLPPVRQARRKLERVEELNARRYELATDGAASKCCCAVSVMIEQRRLDWAIYAGTLRTITPAPVANIQSELRMALGSPWCKGDAS